MYPEKPVFEVSRDNCTFFESGKVSTPAVSNYWYLKVNFLGSENLL